MAKRTEDLEPGDCVICGYEHPYCSGHKRHVNPVRPCMVHPRDMERSCRLHGGNSPQSRAKGAALRLAKEVEADATAALGYSLDGKVPDILGAMEGLAAMQIAQVTALSGRVNALARWRYESEHSIEQIRAEIVLLERATDRAMKFLEVVAKHKPDGEAAAAVNLLTSLADQIKGLAE